MLVKVCGLTSVEDARAAIAAGANALGFNFYAKSKRYVTPEQARAIVDGVSGDYLRVGVFVNATAEEMLSIARAVELHVLQLHGSQCAVPESSTYRIWRAVSGEAPRLEQSEAIEAYLLDNETPDFGGSGRTFAWQKAREWQETRGFPARIIVAGGLDGSNVAAAIGALQPWGVDACSRIEAAPGKKDHAKMREFIQKAQQLVTQ